MHSVFAWKYWLMAVLVICVAVIGVRILMHSDLLQALKEGITLASLIATIFVSSPLWRLLWLLPPVRRMAPPLDGEWSGVVRSNWSIIEATKEAAKQSGAPAIDVDALTYPLPDLKEVPVKATLRTSFFGVELRLETEGERYQISSLKAVEIKPATAAHPPTLSYVFEGRVLDPKPGDVPAFDGAAMLAIEKFDGHLQLEGATWTNRAWRRGLNTAGLIRLERIKPNFWAPLTFGLVKR